MSEHIKFRFPDTFGKTYTRIISNEIPNGVDIINARKVWPYTKGEGVVIAVIDTGIDLDHPDLKDNIIDAVSLIDNDPQDGHGHGTHVAGTIAARENGFGVVGVAPEAKILSIKVIPASGEGYNLPIPEAIDFARSWRGPNGEKVRIINMSLTTNNTPKLYTAFKKATDSGILMFCAPGNQGDGNPETNEFGWPAAWWEAISVGAWDPSGPMAGFSNSNDYLDFIAPGVNVLSTFLNGQLASWSGTSMSLPHGSGIGALLIAGFEKILKREVTEPEVFYAMTKRTRDLGFDSRLQGRGLLDLSLHLDEFVNGPAPMLPQPEVYLVIIGGTQRYHFFDQSEAEEKLHEYVAGSDWIYSGHVERLSDRKVVYSLGPSDKKIVNPKMSLTGKSVATAEQMELYLRGINEAYPYYASLFLQEGEAENIRGDLAYAHSSMMTFFFRFDKGREAGAYNFGMLGDDPTKVSFPDARTGARAFIQHLKAGANNEPLNNPCVDPFFNNVPRGSRPTLESLSGTWHIPGYDPSKGYANLAHAIREKDSYHHWIIQRYEKILNIYIPPGYVAPNPFPDSMEFIAKLQNIADNFRTVYMWGVFGSPVTESIISQKSNQYPSWYTASRQSHLRSLVDKGYFAFDCVNLIKAILWGWTGDPSKAYGGAGYASNGVPDISADGMIAKCNNVSTDFSKIQPGEVVWMEDHIGVYIGSGKVIECTPAWKNGVQVTACLNIGPVPGLNGRTWTKHGKLPYIFYREEESDQMQVAVVYWSLRDFSAMFMVSNAHGGCGTFCRNEIESNIHPDAENAKLMIVIGGPEVNHRPNVINLCGKGAPETQILAAQHVQSLRK